MSPNLDEKIEIEIEPYTDEEVEAILIGNDERSIESIKLCASYLKKMIEIESLQVALEKQKLMTLRYQQLSSSLEQRLRRREKRATKLMAKMRRKKNMKIE